MLEPLFVTCALAHDRGGLHTMAGLERARALSVLSPEAMFRSLMAPETAPEHAAAPLPAD